MMPIEIPADIELPPNLPFDPSHPHLVEVRATVKGEPVAWWFDPFRFQANADFLEERGADIEAKHLRGLNVNYHEIYSEGWSRKPGGRGAHILHYYYRDESSRYVDSLCRRVQPGPQSYLYVLPWSQWAKQRHPPSRCKRCVDMAGARGEL